MDEEAVTKMEYKFNVGDNVVIAQCTDNVSEMKEMIGEIVTIKQQIDGNWGGSYYLAYHIKEDNEKWYWREDWLESVENEINISEDELNALFGSE